MEGQAEEERDSQRRKESTVRGRGQSEEERDSQRITGSERNSRNSRNFTGIHRSRNVSYFKNSSQSLKRQRWREDGETRREFKQNSRGKTIRLIKQLKTKSAREYDTHAVLLSCETSTWYNGTFKGTLV